MKKRNLFKRVWDALFRGPQGLTGEPGRNCLCRCEEVGR